MKSALTLSVLLAVGLSLPGHAQQESGYRSEIGVSALGAFPHGVSGNGIDQTGTDSGGVLASYRFNFTKHHSVEFDYSYTRDTQQFLSPAGAAGVQSNMHEATASYVYRVPMGRLTPFASAGTGAVVFDPISTAGVPAALAGSQARAAFVYSGGVDLSLTRHLSFRAQYRGLVFKAPDFGIHGFDADSVTHLAEPVGGFVWRF